MAHLYDTGASSKGLPPVLASIGLGLYSQFGSSLALLSDGQSKTGKLCVLWGTRTFQYASLSYQCKHPGHTYICACTSMPTILLSQGKGKDWEMDVHSTQVVYPMMSVHKSICLRPLPNEHVKRLLWCSCISYPQQCKAGGAVEEIHPSVLVFWQAWKFDYFRKLFGENGLQLVYCCLCCCVIYLCAATSKLLDSIYYYPKVLTIRNKHKGQGKGFGQGRWGRVYDYFMYMYLGKVAGRWEGGLRDSAKGWYTVNFIIVWQLRGLSTKTLQ